MVISLVAATAVFASLTVYISFREKPAKQASVPTVPTPAPQAGQVVKSYNTENFTNCIFEKGKDALVVNAQLLKTETDKELLYVSLSGNITDIQSVSGNTSIALAAPNGSQSYQFTLPSDKKIVLDTPLTTNPLPVSQLKSFTAISINGTCDPKGKDKSLTIYQINITDDSRAKK